jgi:Na+/proline symporter
VIYGLGAAVLAWRADITSILELLLLGFAMVVPPAVAVGFVLYWRRTTELGAFAGIGVGYFAGLLWYLGGLLLARAAESGDAPVLLGGVARAFAAEAEWTDPSYVTTILPFLVVPIVSLLDRRADDAGRREEFYDRLAPRPDDLAGRAARP